jgi:hypothetical protein
MMSRDAQVDWKRIVMVCARLTFGLASTAAPTVPAAASFSIPRRLARDFPGVVFTIVASRRLRGTDNCRSMRGSVLFSIVMYCILIGAGAAIAFADVSRPSAAGASP